MWECDYGAARYGFSSLSAADSAGVPPTDDSFDPRRTTGTESCSSLLECTETEGEESANPS